MPRFQLDHQATHNTRRIMIIKGSPDCRSATHRIDEIKDSIFQRFDLTNVIHRPAIMNCNPHDSGGLSTAFNSSHPGSGRVHYSVRKLQYRPVKSRSLALRIVRFVTKKVSFFRSQRRPMASASETPPIAPVWVTFG